MALAIGAFLALAVGFFATGLGLDRDRALYPVVTIVVASYYALFAVTGGATHALVPELLVGLAFLVAAAVGFRRSLWLVVIALFAHGVFDSIHAFIVDNPGVPEWWPGFCLGYDAVAAAFLAGLIRRGRIRA